MTTSPGFSSRSTEQHTTQFPQRDEAQMSEQEQEAGWSNSEPVEDAPQDVQAEVEPMEELEPGFSNAKAVKGDEPAMEAESADADEAPDEKPKSTAKKTAAKKTAKKG